MQNDRNNDSSGDKKVGVTLDITIVGVNGDNPLKAKIDTGAEECSLHATDINPDVDNVSGAGSVTFTLGEYKYTMALHGHQAISSADGGTTNRPTIKLGVRIGEDYIPDVVFNLNDRSNMEFPVLVGVSLIKAAGLVVDPSLSEGAMEITFGDTGEKVMLGDPVEVPKETKDNTIGDLAPEDFMSWYNANKMKTIGQLLTELIKGPSTPDVNP